MNRTILYLAADLIWATKIKSTADSLGVNARPVRTVDMLAARLDDTDPAALLLDLEAAEAAWALLDLLAERGVALTTVAWGPHVAVDLMDEARRRGVSFVMTRGAFNTNLPKLLTGLSSEGGAPD